MAPPTGASERISAGSVQRGGVVRPRPARVRRGRHQPEDVIRQAVGWYDDALKRHQVGKAIEDHYLRHPQTGADHAQAMANAIALTEAESW